jgi:3-oxoacyl-[acyl-carrier protein] reductase
MASVMDLTGRRALVCGASRGIGRAAAIAIAERGADVTVLARSAPKLEALVPELLTRGARQARAVPADLDDTAGLVSTLDLILADGPIHVVINNTGGPPGGPLIDATPQALLHALQRHLISAQLIMQRVLPGMRQAGFGRFIQVLSTSVREPIDNLGVSNITRGAMASWAKTLSRELPPGVTINNVLPGFTATDRLDELSRTIASRKDISPEDVYTTWLAGVPEARLADPAELGAVIAFLASPSSSFVRGVSLPVDGGRLHSI